MFAISFSEGLEKLKEASKALENVWKSEDTLQIGNTKLLHNCVKVIFDFLHGVNIKYIWSK